MLHVVTFDFGGYLCDNVRASQQAAADRWGAEYHVLTEPIGAWGGRGAFAAKLDLPDLPFQNPCRVCYLDGDVVVRESCPSLFGLVPAGHFGGVPNYQGDTHADPVRDHAPSWSMMARLMGSSVAYQQDTYINGGVLIFDLPTTAWRPLRAVMANAQRIGPMAEQTGLNISVRMMEVPLCVLPRTYGLLGPAVWRDGEMSEQVYHFAKIGPSREKRAVMERVKWRLG